VKPKGSFSWVGNTLWDDWRDLCRSAYCGTKTLDRLGCEKVELANGQLHLPLPIITTTAVLDLGIDFLDDLVVDRFSNIRAARTLVPIAAA
jgi:hypothetical protein